MALMLNRMGVLQKGGVATAILISLLIATMSFSNSEARGDIAAV